jgi:hypothetical protein
MEEQIHKRLINEQVTMILDRYNKKELTADQAMDLLCLKRHSETLNSFCLVDQAWDIPGTDRAGQTPAERQTREDASYPEERSNHSP